LVKIRLKRMGAKKRPFYRLVVADSRSPRDGKFIEEIGFYDPLPNPAKVQIDADKVREWMRRGARPSDVARKLLEREGILQRSAVVRRATADAGAPAAVTTVAEAEEPAVEGAADEERAVEAEEGQA
jgi:small subunit ribosomal protein S16